MYCSPNCAAANFTALFDAHAWEQWTSVASFTTDGSVRLSNGTTVAALALTSSTTEVAANITQSLTYTANGTTHLFDELFVGVSASSSVEFSPSLGLVPLNLTPAESWSAGSAFTASGTWETQYAVIGPLGGRLDANASGNLTGSGNVTVRGSDLLGPVVVSGQRWTQVSVRLGALTVHGGSSGLALGLDLQDGFALVPRVANIWANTGAWGSSMSLTTSASTSVIDIQGGRGAHIGLESASWSYSTSVNQYDSPQSTSPSDVQATAMSPAAAEASASCLTGGACAGGTSSSSGAAWSGAGAWVIVGVAVAAVIVVAAVLMVRRK
jgi:hypothetical protein